MAVTLPITSRSSSDANNFSDVYANDLAIANEINGGIDNSNLTGSAGITDANLASPNNSTYKLLSQAQGVIVGTGLSFAAADYHFTDGGAPIAEGSNTASAGVPILYLNSLYQPVGGLTQKLRTVATCSTNATASSVTFTVGLFPVSSVAGGSDAITYTLGTVVSGSTVAFASPSTSTITSSAAAADISLPANGAYVLGVTTSGAPSNHSVVQLAVQLWTRNV